MQGSSSSDHVLNEELVSSIIRNHERFTTSWDPNRHKEGCSALYSLLVGLHSEKGGDITRLVHWHGLNHTKGRTLWRQAVVNIVEARVMPLIQKMLQRSPELASKPCKGGAGATPLHVAGYIGLARVAALLLTHGAPPDAATRGGRTPLDEAMYSGHHEIVRLLLGRLSNDAQASARLRIAEYISLPDASLRREELSGIPLPDVPKRRTRIDPAPSDPPGRASCEQGGGWDVKGGLEPPAGSPLAEPSVSALFDHPTIDMRSPDLSASEYYHEYFLKGRPLLIRNAVSLDERCALACSRKEMHAAAGQRKFHCGATAYPELTGRKSCGHFNFLELRDQPRCDDVNRTRPLCNWKLGRMRQHTLGDVKNGIDWNADGVNLAAGFKEMPERLRHKPELPPIRMMRGAWSISTSRALWGGTAWSGSGFHYHNPAYNVLFFGTKKWMITPPRYACACVIAHCKHTTSRTPSAMMNFLDSDSPSRRRHSRALTIHLS